MEKTGDCPVNCSRTLAAFFSLSLDSPTQQFITILEIFKITLEKINTSYKSGGASVRDYSDIKGKEGTFSFTFAVYKKKKDPLGNKIVMEKTKDGRTTHWVP